MKYIKVSAALLVAAAAMFFTAEYTQLSIYSIGGDGEHHLIDLDIQKLIIE